MTEQPTKLKLYVAFVKLNLAITEAARLNHLNAKHPTESSPRLDDRQPTLHDFSRKITKAVREKVTIWVAGDCRPINIVEDSGLIEVIRIASGEILTIYRRGAPLCLKKNTIKQQFLKYTLSEVITCLFIIFSLNVTMLAAIASNCHVLGHWRPLYTCAFVVICVFTCFPLCSLTCFPLYALICFPLCALTCLVFCDCHFC